MRQVNPTVAPEETATDPLVLALRRLHASLTVAMLRAERNPTTAAVHGVRVAARRLRSLLRAFRADLHPILYAGLNFDLKNLGRTLGPLREASVRRRLVRSMSRSPGNFVALVGVRATKLLNAQLADAERRLQTDARRLVMLKPWSERTQRIDDALTSSALVGVAPLAARSLGGRALHRRLQRVLKHLHDRRTSQQALHRLRLAVKKARYLADVLGESADAPRIALDSELVKLLHKLQNSLGDLNDHFGLRDWIAAQSMELAMQSLLASEVELRIDLRLARFRKLRKSVRSKIGADPLLRT